MILLFSIALFNPTVISKSVKITKEKAVCIKTELSSIKLDFKKAETDSYLINANLNYDSTTVSANFEYKVEKDTGRLNLTEERTGQSDMLNPTSQNELEILSTLNNNCKLRLNKKLPLDLDLTVGSASIDLTNLKVTQFALSTNGNSTVTINFPNTTPCKNFNIMSQFGGFNGIKLGNANFETLYFQGGIGAYTLDLNGDFNGTKRVEIILGTGQMELILPDDAGVKLKTSGVHLRNIKRLAKDKNGWYVKDMQNSKRELIIHIDGSLGVVTVK